MPDKQGKWLPEEEEKINRVINGFERMLCPSCRRQDMNWSLGKYAAGFFVAQDLGRHFPVAIIFCTNCGHARMYHTKPLLALDEEGGS